MVKKQTSDQVKPKRKAPNPEGKGGFVKGESGNPGGRPKDVQRYDYWLQFFKNMSVAKFKAYTKTRKENAMYVAEAQAYQRINESLKDLKTWQIVADRTEGKAQASVDLTSAGEQLGPVVVEILHGSINKT